MLLTRLEIVDAEAETVRRIYEMFASGLTVPEIAKILNAEQVPVAEIGKLAEYVSAYLGKYSGAGSANLETIQQTGKRLSEVARIVESRMRADHD